MTYYQSSFTPSFLSYFIFNNKCGNSIQNMNASLYYLKPIWFWEAISCQKTSYNIHNNMILSFANTILLRRISCGKLPFDFISLIKIRKFMWVVLLTTTCSKTLVVLSSFLISFLYFFKGFKSFIFFLQKINSKFPIIIINKDDYMSFISIKKIELLTHKYQNK